MNPAKLLQRLAQGAVQNVAFADFVGLVEVFGFRPARTSGSHHIFLHRGIPEQLNLQDANGQAKPYQIR